VPFGELFPFRGFARKKGYHHHHADEGDAHRSCRPSQADCVEFGLKFRGVPHRERRPIVDLILFKVGLLEFDKHFPAQLSGGMQQRVGLARVLVNRPRVMLMDEPFSAIDAQTRLMMQELLLQVWSEYRMTVIFVTHDIDEAVYLGLRVAVLTRRPGRLKALFDVDLPRPRAVDVLVSKEFMKLKRSCMDLVREETLGLQWRKEKLASEADVCREAFLAESANAAA
jgi:ABC-type nitrate/sulfonate/bicarbonate transport system ATPase subunit